MINLFKNIDNTFKNNYSQIFLSALFLLSFIFLNVLLSSILFIFKVSINHVTPIISMLISIIINVIFLSKSGLLKEHIIKNLLIAIALPILIIIFSIAINGKIIDYTWDGNSYQKATTGMLAIGWNPLYNNIEEFEEKNDLKIKIKDESPIYINHYPRAVNIYAANIYKLTGNIETGKSINTISIIMLFLFTLSFLLYKDETLFFSLFFAICVVTYPVICAQFLTNYIDLIVYTFLYLTIFMFFLFEEKLFKFDYKLKYFIYFMVLVLSINIKFSLFAYAGIYCLGYYIMYFCKFIKNKVDKKFFLTFTLVSIFSVLVGVFVVGLSVYPKNFIQNENPFYPLMGKDKIDIMTANQPNYFKEKSPIEKFIISTFSKAADIVETTNEEAEYKVPFSASKDELWSISAPDLRISGNGIFFSGIFIISILIIAIFGTKFYKNNKEDFYLYVIPLLITVVMIFTLGEAWWARYFPQLYFFVLFAIILLNECFKNKVVLALKYLFILVILINNMITFVYSVKRAYSNNVIYNKEFMDFEAENFLKESNLNIYTNYAHGAKFNIIDKYYKKYKIDFYNESQIKNEEIKTFIGGRIKWECVE